MDEREHTVDQWKELIYDEVMEYEMSHNSPGLVREPGATATGVRANASAASNSEVTNADSDQEVMRHRSNNHR